MRGVERALGGAQEGGFDNYYRESWRRPAESSSRNERKRAIIPHRHPTPGSPIPRALPHARAR